jgi:hypothetical protein
MLNTPARLGLIATLLCTAGAALAQAPAPASPTPAAPATKTEPKPEQVIKDLEKSAPPAPATPRPAATPAGSPAPASPLTTTPTSPAPAATLPGKLVREGTFITSRRGRVIRAGSGEWMFHFDQASAAPAEPPMILMPSMNLMAIEKLAERGGESLTFRVSGQVFVYHGKNYLLPSMYQVNRRPADGAKE